MNEDLASLDPTPPAERRKTWIRLGVLALGVLLSLVIAHATGLTEYMTRENVRALIVGLGPVGVLVFVALFVVGELAHVPGWVFIGAAILAYGRGLGGLVGYLGALAAVAVAFVVVRAIGGQALTSIRRPFLVRVLLEVDRRPIAAVTVLRILLIMTPALTYALALTRIRFRDYMLGSALGLVLPITVMSLLFDWLLS